MVSLSFAPSSPVLAAIAVISSFSENYTAVRAKGDEEATRVKRLAVEDLVLQTQASLSHSHVHTANTDDESQTSLGHVDFIFILLPWRFLPI